MVFLLLCHLKLLEPSRFHLDPVKHRKSNSDKKMPKNITYGSVSNVDDRLRRSELGVSFQRGPE